jgi:hypothetical protein
MKAKTLNEIKKGSDPLTSVGVGKVSVLKAYAELMKEEGKFFFEDTMYRTLPKLLTAKFKELLPEHNLDFSDFVFLSNSIIAASHPHVMNKLNSMNTPDISRVIANVDKRVATSYPMLLKFWVTYNFDLNIGTFIFEYASEHGSLISRMGRLIKYK